MVIAIIGILSAIVLASLNNARSKANDASVQSQLASMRAGAEIYFANNSSSYGTGTNCSAGMFNDTSSGLRAIVIATVSIRCTSNNVAWAASAPLISNASNAWCVDSRGTSKNITNASFNVSNSVCP